MCVCVCVCVLVIVDTHENRPYALCVHEVLALEEVQAHGVSCCMPWRSEGHACVHAPAVSSKKSVEWSVMKHRLSNGWGRGGWWEEGGGEGVFASFLVGMQCS